MLLYCPLLYPINNMRFAKLAKDENDIAEALLICAVSLKANVRTEGRDAIIQDAI
jgi:hypothetical protein